MIEPVVRRLGGTVVERSQREPPSGVPLAVRSVQHVHVSAGRFPPPRSGHNVLATWVVAGEVAIGIRKRRLTFRPGEVAIYLPSIDYAFWALTERAEMCWFSMDGPLAEPFVLDLGLRPSVYPYGPAPIDEIHRLSEALKDETLQGCRRASLMAVAMLYEIANRAAPVRRARRTWFAWRRT